MKYEPISLNDSTMEIVLKMAEGNPGAATVIAQIIKDDPMGIMDLLHLDDMGMRGGLIWIAFKNHCDSDMTKFREAIKNRDKAMIETVNKHAGGGGRKAVAHGASFA